MPNVEFEEDVSRQYHIRSSGTQRQHSTPSIIRMILKTGLTKDETVAEKIIIILSVLFMLLAVAIPFYFGLFPSNTSGKEIPKSPEDMITTKSIMR